MKMNLTLQNKGSFLTRFLLIGVFLVTLSMPTWAQEKITVSGKILDNTNEPLPGAAVLVQGSKDGTQSDINGEYVITVNSNAVLEFSFIGFKSQSVSVNGRAKINVTLEPDATMLQEVVAIGYGSQRKEDLSMAVSSVKMDDIMRSRSSDLGTVLQGRLPGVTVQKSGDPMASTSFTIRGRGSKGNDGDVNSGDGVLFVVDGVPNAPYMVEDIESITILKDAASAAIYGASVGSSGVVLITTKKPQAGKTHVDVNASFGFDQVTNLPTLLTAQQFCDVWAKAIENAPGKTLPTSADPTQYKWANVTNTDWLNEIFRKGFRQHYAATVSGGGDKLQSVLSVSYDDNKGVLLNTWSKVFSGKLQSDWHVAKWLKLYERVSVKVSNGQGNVNTSHQGPIMAAMWYPRSATVWETNEDGTLALDAKGEKYYGGTSPKWTAGSVSGTPLVYNPVADLQRMHRLYPETKVFSTTGIEIKPISSLTIKSEFTADLRQAEEDTFYPVMKEAGLERAKNFREQFLYRDNHWMSETTISWAQVFGKHHISAMGGFTADFKKTHERAIFTRDYLSEDKDQLLWGQAKDWSSTQPRESIYEYAMASFLGRIGYSYDDRYFLTASIRRDASSKLPVAKNYDWFPAVSGSWKLSSEHFYANSAVKDVMNLVKFRAGWGKVGNVDLFPTNVAEAQLLAYDWPIIFGKDLTNQMTGTYLNTIPNLNARWETTEQTSVGLDLGFFNSALEISVDWYNKRTKDLIDQIPTPLQLGVKNSPYGNMGDVQNKGWEFSINYNGTAAHGALNYNVWGMFSTNDGKVKSYGVRKDPVRHDTPNLNSTAILYSDAGYPWYSFRIYETSGIFRSQDEIDNYVWTDPETGASNAIQPSAKVGDLKYVDTNNDGKISDADRVMKGSYAPVNTFSFGGSLNWKGLDFSFMFQGVSGNYVYNGMKQMSMVGGNAGYGNMRDAGLDTWDFNPTSSKYPRLGIAEDTNGNYFNFSDIFLEKGDYLRLKNITLGYTLPIKNSNVPKIRVYGSVDNVCTITGYSGIDPEVGNYGVDRGVYPVARTFNFGVNLNF